MSLDIKEYAIVLLSTTTVDLQTDANTTLYTVPTGYRCVLDHADIICGTAASTTAVITIGQSTALTDFLNSQTLTNLAAQYDVVHCYPVPNATPVKNKSYAAGTVIQLDVGTADADGSDDATVKLFGYLYAV
jgi:hypothetical protein